MRYIKLFEEVFSTIPTKHTKDSIKSMSIDDLGKALEIYHKEGRNNEIISVIDIWVGQDGNKIISLSGEDKIKFLDILDKYEDLRLRTERNKDLEAMSKYIKSGVSEIRDTIKNLEERLDRYKKNLESALRNEEYENAAKINSEIKSVKWRIEREENILNRINSFIIA